VVALIMAAAFRHPSGTVSRPTGTASSVRLRKMEGDVPDRERYLDFDALDWGLTEPVVPDDPDDPTSRLRIPVSLVARVRLPTSLVFDVLRSLNHAMTRYEATFGEIRRPEAQ
jgi:hypothetical protein